MPTAQEIASKMAWISAQLTAGGTNAQMKKWYYEYKELAKELKAAKATDNSTEDHGQGNPDDRKPSPSSQQAIEEDNGSQGRDVPRDSEV